MFAWLVYVYIWAYQYKLSMSVCVCLLSMDLCVFISVTEIFLHGYVYVFMLEDLHECVPSFSARSLFLIPLNLSQQLNICSHLYAPPFAILS